MSAMFAMPLNPICGVWVGLRTKNQYKMKSKMQAKTKIVIQNLASLITKTLLPMRRMNWVSFLTRPLS
jgi:hypothetical protein